MKLMWLWIIVLVQKSLQNDENTTVVAVGRRLLGDTEYYPEERKPCSRADSKVTFLVNERQCVTNEELFTECSSAIIPTDSTELVAIADSSMSSSITALVVKADDKGGILFHFNETDQAINSSVCRIASLEVYRGRKQAIEINYEGFSLSDYGAIKINFNKVSYIRKDYVGELYRMNLSCSGGGLPESGCLFFKVFGETNITNAKFNCTVPGTITEKCNNTPTTSTISTTTSPTKVHNMTTTASLSPNSGFELGGTYFLIVVICGVVVVTLLVAIVLMCFMVCLLRRKIKPSSAQTAPLGEDSCKLQDLDTKPDERYHTTMAQEYETVNDIISNGVQTTGGESPIYAALETPKNPRHYTDPIKSNPNKMKEHPSNSVQQKEHLEQVPPEAQYESPNSTTKENSNKPQLVEGLSDDVSEHKYAVLERQPLTPRQPPQGGAIHHYDDPPREDGGNRPHWSDEQYDDDPANHTYAMLEKL